MIQNCTNKHIWIKNFQPERTRYIEKMHETINLIKEKILDNEVCVGESVVRNCLTNRKHVAQVYLVIDRDNFDDEKVTFELRCPTRTIDVMLARMTLSMRSSFVNLDTIHAFQNDEISGAGTILESVAFEMSLLNGLNGNIHLTAINPYPFYYKRGYVVCEDYDRNYDKKRLNEFLRKSADNPYEKWPSEVYYAHMKLPKEKIQERKQTLDEKAVLFRNKSFFYMQAVGLIFKGRKSFL